MSTSSSSLSMTRNGCCRNTANCCSCANVLLRQYIFEPNTFSNPPRGGFIFFAPNPSLAPPYPPRHHTFDQVRATTSNEKGGDPSSQRTSASCGTNSWNTNPSSCTTLKTVRGSIAISFRKI